MTNIANCIWILGADDPEMSAIETLLRECGERVLYATVDGQRAHSENAYQADALSVDFLGLDVYYVECKVANECGGAHLCADQILHYPGAVRVLLADSQQDVDDRQVVADRIYSVTMATGASQQEAEDAVAHAGFSAH